MSSSVALVLINFANFKEPAFQGEKSKLSLSHLLLCRTNLHGANIYRDSCTIKVEFAKQDVLNVKRNDDKTWDYTATGQTKVNGQVNGGSHAKVTVQIITIHFG